MAAKKLQPAIGMIIQRKVKGGRRPRERRLLLGTVKGTKTTKGSTTTWRYRVVQRLATLKLTGDIPQDYWKDVPISKSKKGTLTAKTIRADWRQVF